MGRSLSLILAAVLLSSICACSGVRKTATDFTAHAESITIVGYAIPEDDQLAARSLVPEGATITNETSTPVDWTSVLGVIGKILWVNGTTISGTLSEGEVE